METKTAHLRNGLWTVGENKNLTQDEFEKLKALHPGTRWICFVPYGYKSTSKNKLDFKNAR